MAESPILLRAFITAFSLLNGAILYLFVLQFPFSAEAFLTSLKHWQRLSPRIEVAAGLAIAAVVIALLVDARTSPAWKNTLVFFKLRHAHPAHNAFFGGRDPGFDLGPIDRAYPEIKDSAWAPEVQYKIWRKLHHKHSDNRVISGPRHTWTLLRKLYTLSVAFLLVFLIAWPLNAGASFAVAAPYLFVFGGQTLFLLLSARSMAWRLVSNVLGTELGLGPDARR